MNLHDLVEAVELGARHLARTGVQRADRSAAAENRFKDFELGATELLADVLNLKPKAKVGAVAAVTEHRLVVSDPRPRSRGNRKIGRLEYCCDRSLADLDHLVFVNKRHLDVELRELRLTVGAQVLVAEAAGNLEVTLVAGHHQQLLEELGRLRQRVPVARVHPAGNEEVARALRRRLRQDRRFNFEEVALDELLAQGLRD